MAAQRLANPARDDVEVEMEHGLSASCALVLAHHQTFRLHASFHGGGHFLHADHIRPPGVGGHVDHAAHGQFGNHQRVSLRLRHHIEKGERNLVLKHFVGGQFTAQNAGEDVFGLVGIGIWHNVS